MTGDFVGCDVGLLVTAAEVGAAVVGCEDGSFVGFADVGCEVSTFVGSAVVSCEVGEED